ncbi:MAG: DNA polymerase IV, partial [Mycobacterium sp.]
TLPYATCSTHTILATARRLVVAAAPLIAERGLTLVGFAVSEIDRSGAEQLTLPFTTRPEPAAVDAAVDQVRRRYGKSALTRGVLVGRDTGLEVPRLPD